MSTFGGYAGYYDLLYRDKDYCREVDFISNLLSQYAPHAKRICELGCGTGQHATLLAEKGYSVHGTDMSDTMLERARAKLASLPAQTAERLKFSHGDARTVRLGSQFDAVISLFHVVSYQVTNDDLIDMFQTASSHVMPGGVFVFDYWYGPAVLTERPAVRIKRMEAQDIAVTRLAEPEIHLDKSSVDVNYQICIRDKTNGAVQDLHEIHRMRYLFATEIDLIARMTDFRVLHSCAWLSTAPPSADSWSVCSVLGK